MNASVPPAPRRSHSTASVEETVAPAPRISSRPTSQLDRVREAIASFSTSALFPDAWIARAVWYTQMFPEDTPPEIKYWVLLPRYDVRVAAPIHVPEEFDPYALRQILTKLLADRFGLEIYVKQKCQPPCGRYNVPLTEDE